MLPPISQVICLYKLVAEDHGQWGAVVPHLSFGSPMDIWLAIQGEECLTKWELGLIQHNSPHVLISSLQMDRMPNYNSHSKAGEKAFAKKG